MARKPYLLVETIRVMCTKSNNVMKNLIHHSISDNITIDMHGLEDVCQTRGPRAKSGPPGVSSAARRMNTLYALFFELSLFYNTS